MLELLRCGLCEGEQLSERQLKGSLCYADCTHCGLITLDPHNRLHPKDEEERYRLHQNSPEDPRYREFLSRAVDPLLIHLSPGMVGLDYGCGPGPAISVMLGALGFVVDDYDPFFSPISLRAQYDFIICTETIEHFCDPRKEFDQISRLIRPGGRVVLMTEVYSEQIEFEQWWYIKDPTHVSLYRAETLKWIADHYGWKMSIPHKNVRFYSPPT